jgi:hypothetical protein
MMKIANDTLKVVVGTQTYRAGAFIIEKFLSNQKEIQQNYPSSEMVLATAEDDFIGELGRLFNLWGLRGKVILYQTVKPDYARSGVWNVACGREALRQYVLLKTQASYMLCVDADMTYNPHVIEIMEKEIQGYDFVHSGYPLRDFGIALIGTGCTMLTRNILEKLEFRCCEFKNGQVIPEDCLLEVDLFELRSKIKKD